MDPDGSTLVLRHFGAHLHGVCVLTSHRASQRSGTTFGCDVIEDLDTEGLLGQVLWSISCAPGDVSAVAFQRLREAGLFLVRLSLAGAADAPAPRADVVAAVGTLRRLGILIDYDLDLFQGSPRFAAVRQNLALLRAVVADGTTAACFQAAELRSPCSPWLETFRGRLSEAVRPWLHSDGLSYQLAEAWAELTAAERLNLGMTGVAAHRIALQRLTLACNTELLTLIAASAVDFEASGDTGLLDQELIGSRCAPLRSRLLALRNDLLADLPGPVAVRVSGGPARAPRRTGERRPPTARRAASPASRPTPAP